jgi:hypothetical protein
MTKQEILGGDESLKTLIRHPGKVIRYFFEYSRLGLLKHYLQALGKKDAVFIWIPRTAGTSVFSVLNKYGCPKLKTLNSASYCFPQRGIVTFGHMNYSELLQENYVSKKFDESSFKFCFSRNPYDRAISLFFYLNNYMNRSGTIQEDSSFLAFCRHLENRGVEEIGLYNRCGLSQCNPQVRWVENTNIDFIGKIETINKDFEKVLEVLGLPRVKLPRLNATSHDVYSKYYCEESRKIIGEFYQEDFYFFGYEF